MADQPGPIVIVYHSGGDIRRVVGTFPDVPSATTYLNAHVPTGVEQARFQTLEKPEK